MNKMKLVGGKSWVSDEKRYPLPYKCNWRGCKQQATTTAKDFESKSFGDFDTIHLCLAHAEAYRRGLEHEGRGEDDR